MCACCCSVAKPCPTLLSPWAAAGQAPLSSLCPRVLSHPLGGDASTPHPLSVPSPLPSLFPRIRVFSTFVDSSYLVATVIELQSQQQCVSASWPTLGGGQRAQGWGCAGHDLGIPSGHGVGGPAGPSRQGLCVYGSVLCVLLRWTLEGRDRGDSQISVNSASFPPRWLPSHRSQEQ